MRVVSLEEIGSNHKGIRDVLIHDLKAGACMIYPTDTVYGIGTVDDVRYIQTVGAFKERDMNVVPYSIIAPSFDWIDTQYPSDQSSQDRWEALYTRYPGRGITCIYDPSSSGVRFLGDHPIQQIVQGVGVPFVTTSANITGKPTITSVKDFEQYPASKKTLIDRVIDGGVLSGMGSVVIDISTGSTLRE